MMQLKRSLSSYKIAYHMWKISNALKLNEEQNEFILFNSTKFFYITVTDWWQQNT